MHKFLLWSELWLVIVGSLIPSSMPLSNSNVIVNLFIQRCNCILGAANFSLWINGVVSSEVLELCTVHSPYGKTLGSV